MPHYRIKFVRTVTYTGHVIIEEHDPYSARQTSKVMSDAMVDRTDDLPITYVDDEGIQWELHVSETYVDDVIGHYA